MDQKSFRNLIGTYRGGDVVNVWYRGPYGEHYHNVGRIVAISQAGEVILDTGRYTAVVRYNRLLDISPYSEDSDGDC